MTALLSVRGIEKRFGGLAAINDLSFDVKAQELCGIIGPNGAGKTTLMNLITGYMAPSAGAILFKGHAIQGARPHRICHLGIGRTFQIVRPFGDMTVEENVMSGALFSRRVPCTIAQARSAAQDRLHLVGLYEKRGLDAAKLTLGEKKRLELARSLATAPDLLLLDEVMGGLSDPEIAKLVETLRQVHATGTTIVMVEHVLRALLQLASRLVVLDFGRKIADGPTTDVMRDPEVIACYLGKPAGT